MSIIQVKHNGKYIDKDIYEEMNGKPFSKPSKTKDYYKKAKEKVKSSIGSGKNLKNPFMAKSPHLTESASQMIRTARFFKRGIFGK